MSFQHIPSLTLETLTNKKCLPTLSAVVSALFFTFSLKRQCNAILYLGSNDALQGAFGGHPKAGEQAKGAA